jgi:hypothetical protein
LALTARLHYVLINAIMAHGHAPSLTRLADALDVTRETIAAALGELSEMHGLVLHPHSHDVWVIHPFALSPTNVWVQARAKGWWAPCLWCALGIAALVAEDVVIHARVGGEAEPLAITVSDGKLGGDAQLVVHFPIALLRAWDNVIHFCATVQPFRGEAEIEAWCARHGYQKGAIVPLGQLEALARRWYGRHAELEWQKWSRAEARAIFSSVGLSGPHWALDEGDDEAF